MNKRSHSPVTEMLSGKYKIWLMVGLGVLFVIDLSAWAVLLAAGVGASYATIPCLAAIADLVYLGTVAFSNQRFKYARSFFTVYIFISIILCLVWLLNAFVGAQAVYDSAIATAWTVFHIFGIAAIMMTYLYATRLIRAGRTVQLVLAIALSCIAVLGSGIYYGIYLFKDGYFGQGETRALVYTCYGDGTCEVSDIVEGKSDSVVVPYEFNGYKVVRVSANVLTDGINTVTLKCDTDATLFYHDLGEIPTVEINYDVTINVDKENIDVVKSSLYGRPNTRDLGNRLFPIGLDDDEVYITFDYDYRAIGYAGGHLIPTWFGKKGDVFDLSEYEDLQYVQRSDISSDDDMYFCFNRYGNIMSELKAGDAPIDGMAVNDSCANVKVRFQKIFKLYTFASNDSMYEPADYFKCSVVDGVQLAYKLAVADNADRLLDGFDRGEGFERRICIQSSPYSQIPSLEEYLQTCQETEVGISPFWELVQPKVTVKPVGGSTDVVYGNEFSLEAEIEHPILDELNVSYEWADSASRISVEPMLKVSKTIPVGRAEYTVIVKLTAPKLTSLANANADNIYMNITRRPLTVNWTDPESSVYDGNEKTITAELENTLQGDNVRLSNTAFTQTNASTYTYTATLYGADSSNYYIAEGEKHTYSVTPRPTELTWDDKREFEYDGNLHNPTAIAYSLTGEGLLVSVSGAATEAGEYTVTALRFYDSNYTISDSSEKSVKYIIKPKQVDVTWSNTELTYNGQSQAPTATATGVKGEKIDLVVIGGQINANLIDDKLINTYTALATTGSPNYTVNPATARQEFTIEPYTVTVQWGTTTLTYNGKAQVPTAWAIGVNGQEIEMNVYAVDVKEIIDAVDVGGYTAWADSGLANYKQRNQWQAFTITEKTVDVTVNDITIEYGKPMHCSYTIDGVESGDDVTVTCFVDYTPDKNGNIPVGTYEIKAIGLTGAKSSNYKINVVKSGTLTVTAPRKSAEG